jgi:hypothetical protein
MMVWMLAMGCFGNQHIRKVSNLSKNWNPSVVFDLLESPHAYVRLHTLQEIRRHNWIPEDETQIHLAPVLVDLISSNDEACPIRGQASYVAGRWNLKDVSLSIQNAMSECDDESRYWMTLGLMHFSDDPYAKGIIHDLRTDGDIFIRNEAIRWSQP